MRGYTYIWTEENAAKVVAAMKAGATDLSLSRETGASRRAVRKLRIEAGIAPIPFAQVREMSRQGNLTPEVVRAQIHKLSNLGMSERAIKDESGVDRLVIRKARRAAGILYVRKPSDTRQRPYRGKPIKADRDALYSDLKRAVSFCRDRNISEDAISDMYVAVLAGELSPADIAAEARKYTGRVLNTYASRWAPASLDQLVYDESRETHLDRLACPASAAAMDLALMRGLNLTQAAA